MKTYIATLFIVVMASVIITSCGGDKKINSNEVTQTAVSDTIPYVVADNYFVRNDVDSVPTVITDKQIFDSCFGAAPVMGENGEPTPIDFSKQYVIAVTLPDTDMETSLEAGTLTKNNEGGYTFTYNVKQGDKTTFTIRPLLLAVVSREYLGNVRTEIAKDYR